MMQPTTLGHRGMIGFHPESSTASALASLARHSARDTVLIASRCQPPIIESHPATSGLTQEDIDGLSMVIRDLSANHLDLVLHGFGGGLDSGSELIALLRGRYNTIRAVVPSAALSVMSLISLTCDSTVMPDTAVLGTVDDPYQPRIGPDEAADWVIHNCSLPESEERARFASTLFSSVDGPRSPITAAHARDLGLAIHLVGERTGIGADIRCLGESLESGSHAGAYSTMIANHRGAQYLVRG